MNNVDESSQEFWRMFIAAELPLGIREQLTEHVKTVRLKVPDARASWTKPENIHLTLKFLGHIERSRVEQLSEAAARAVEGIAPFEIIVCDTGVFPSARLARVLWIGIEDRDAKLKELYRRLEEECTRARFAKDDRPFRPHLTVARLRKPQQALGRDLKRSLISAHQDTKFEPSEMAIAELLVIRSELGKDGSRYSAISRHRLS